MIPLTQNTLPLEMNTYLAIALGCDFPILEAIRHALVNLDPNRWLLKAAEYGDLETVKLADVWRECLLRAERTDHSEIVIYAMSKQPTSDGHLYSREFLHYLNILNHWIGVDCHEITINL